MPIGIRWEMVTSTIAATARTGAKNHDRSRLAEGEVEADKGDQNQIAHQDQQPAAGGKRGGRRRNSQQPLLAGRPGLRNGLPRRSRTAARHPQSGPGLWRWRTKPRPWPPQLVPRSPRARLLPESHANWAAYR